MHRYCGGHRGFSGRPTGHPPSAAALSALRGMLLVAAMLAGGCSTSDDETLTMADHHTIPLPGSILSTPAIVTDASRRTFGFGLVRGLPGTDQDSTLALDLLDPRGQSLPGFPVLRQGRPYLIAPASQVAAVEGAGGAMELVAVDLQGYLWRAQVGGGAPVQSAHGDPARGLLSAAPLVLQTPGQAARLVLVSQDFTPSSPSRNAVHLVDLQGACQPGFPVELPARPAPVAPQIDGDRLFILLENGQVVGLALGTGAPLPGFPSAAPEPWPALPRLALYSPWGGPVLATGDDRLLRVGPGGALDPVFVPQAQRIVGLAVAGEQLLALDTGQDLLLTLNAKAQVVASAPLGLSAADDRASLQAFPVAGGTLVVVVASSAADHAASVAAAFAQHAPNEMGRTIQQLAEETALRDYHTTEREHMTPAQREAFDFDITAMKYSWLQDNLGMETATALAAAPPVTRIIVDSHGNAGVRALVAETVPNRVQLAQGSLSPAPLPALLQLGNTWLLAVPLQLTPDAARGGPPVQSELLLYSGNP